MNSRIPVNESTHLLLRDFARGLGVNMNEALLYLLSEKIDISDDPLLAGHAQRDNYEIKKKQLRELEKPKKKK